MDSQQVDRSIEVPQSSAHSKIEILCACKRRSLSVKLDNIVVNFIETIIQTVDESGNKDVNIRWRGPRLI